MLRVTLTALDDARERTTDVAAIEVRGLVKTYGKVKAVQGIDLSVAPGELFGFLGPNGAGKSTTIKILCTLVNATSGTATVAGFDVRHQRADVRRNIGLVFQDPTVDEYLSAEQNLQFHAAIYGMPRRSVGPRIEATLNLVGLLDRRKDPVKTFSGGMKRRLEIARGLLHSPRVLFLDEPTIGLDPESRRSLWTYVDQLRQAEHITIFLTTHYMDEAERCGRIAIVNGGQIVALGSPDELKAQIGVDQIRFQTTDDAAAVAALAADGIEAVPDGDGLRIGVPDGEAFVPRLFEIGVPIRSVRVDRPSLDDVFLAHAGRRIGDEPAAPARRFPGMGRR
jgi:ABC-2 type transport system ATP-binding protein